MRTKTYPYGTTRRATVLGSEKATNGTSFITLVDELDEGHVLIGCGTEVYDAGAKGTLTFTEGGPTGGYWHFTPDEA